MTALQWHKLVRNIAHFSNIPLGKKTGKNKKTLTKNDVMLAIWVNIA